MAKESIIFVGLFTAILSAAILLVSCAEMISPSANMLK